MKLSKKALDLYTEVTRREIAWHPTSDEGGVQRAAMQAAIDAFVVVANQEIAEDPFSSLVGLTLSRPTGALQFEAKARLVAKSGFGIIAGIYAQLIEADAVAWKEFQAAYLAESRQAPQASAETPAPTPEVGG